MEQNSVKMDNEPLMISEMVESKSVKLCEHAQFSLFMRVERELLSSSPVASEKVGEKTSK